MQIDEKTIQQIIEETLDKFSQDTYPRADTGDIRYGNALDEPGCFDDVDEAIMSAKEAQRKLAKMTVQERGRIIRAMRDAAMEHVKYLAELAHDETGFGRVEDKIIKNKLAIEKTPGIEDLSTEAYTGDDGLTLVERAPYGVIGSITPSTNPSSTIINNSIGMVAAGNAVVFNPHPGAKKVSIETIRILNQAIYGVSGIRNLLTTSKNPTIETSRRIMEHEDIRLLVVTGGESVVKVAMKSGKKVIAAGPGNPPCIVDNTANINKAASDIVKGASFDNNILCIAEKEVFVFRDVAKELISLMESNGCYRASLSEIDKLTDIVLVKNKEGKYAPNKKYVGKNASHILSKCGIHTTADYKLILAEVPYEHPFVSTEMLMPVLPIVVVDTLDEAIEKAIEAENGCKHTAIMHSENVNNLTKAALALDTTIFVKNAPSYAGLGIEGEGYTTLTIATPTGEGLTSAKNFTRSRRCTLSGSFRII